MHDIIVTNMIASERDRFAEASSRPDAPLPFEVAVRSLFARIAHREVEQPQRSVKDAKQSCGNCACQPVR